MRFILSGLAGLCAIGSIPFFYPITAQQGKIERTEVTRTYAGDGAAMYGAYCAACHGLRGRGDGPASPALKVPAADLTVLTRNNDGVFPTLAVLSTLRPNGGAHGNADMPVWGDVFRQAGQSPVVIDLRTYNLARYLESIQQPAPPPAKRAKEAEENYHRVSDVRATFGGEMYRVYCASCHGLDGQGGGPVASTLKARPSDLTKLRGPDGKFDRLRVAHTLSMKSGGLAHGSSDMPIWGVVFHSTGEDSSVSALRVFNLTRYIESIQR